MKTVYKRLGFLVRAGLFAGLLVSGQQALAQTAYVPGTNAGTTIDNTASVTFSVAGVQQSAVDSDTATFEVDRRVDFELVPVSPGLELIAPNQQGLILSFTLTNESNDTLDFSLGQAALGNGDAITGIVETATGESMSGVDIEVAPSFIGGGGTEDPSPGAGNDNVNNLPPGETIRINIYSNAPVDLPDLSRPAIELSVSAEDSDGNPITDDSGDADLPGVVQNVLVDGGVTRVVSDGFEVTAADVTATKDSEVVEDPFSGTTNPKAIPGAYVEYTFVVTNAASGDATDVTITDSLDTTVVQLLNGAYDDGGTAVNVDLGGGNFCNADAVDDGCTYDPGTGDLEIVIGTLAGGSSQTIKFQVVIQ